MMNLRWLTRADGSRVLQYRKASPTPEMIGMRIDIAWADVPEISEAKKAREWWVDTSEAIPVEENGQKITLGELSSGRKWIKVREVIDE